MTNYDRDALALKVFGHGARFVVVRTSGGVYQASVRYQPPWHSIEVNVRETVFESTDEQGAIDAAERELIEIAASRAADEAWNNAAVAVDNRDIDALTVAAEKLRSTRR